MINRKHGQGTHCTKMGADGWAENTPNAPEFICPICLPKPKSSGFQWKKASSVVHSPWITWMLLCLVTKHVFLQLDLGYMIGGDRNYARSSLQAECSFKLWKEKKYYWQKKLKAKNINVYTLIIQIIKKLLSETQNN